MAEGLRIIERKGLRLAAVMARKGVAAESIGAKLGLAPPVGPQVARDAATTLVGTAPGMWLAIAEDGRPGWVEQLSEALAGAASVSDQSSGYLVLRISGDGAQALLQKGAFIDLDPSVFPAGSAAVTVIAHIGVILWKVDDAPTFDVALFRSFEGSFSDWIAWAAPGAAVQIPSA